MIEFVIQFVSSALLVEEIVRPPIAKAENAIKEAIDGVRGTWGGDRGQLRIGGTVRSLQRGTDGSRNIHAFGRSEENGMN